MKNKSGAQRSRLIQFLLCSSSYPNSPAEVKHIQTHASDVFIAAPYVYKIKKPVDFGFLDYSTLERRKYHCEKELKLNKRLCCVAYLGIEEISLKDGVLILGAGDETVEYVVKMNLLPEEYFLHNLLKNDTVSEADFSRIAEKLANYYNSQGHSQEISKYGKPNKIKSVIDQNLDFSKQFIGKTISANTYRIIESYNNDITLTKSSLFIKRMEDGWIRDCHGDLRIEHINMLSDDVCIYDCIEFNEKFRHIDIASDVAFLSMDLDHQGYSRFSSFFINEISRLMKDDSIYDVLDFYKCYRAFVRGKVETIKALESEVPENERELARKSADSFFKLALKYALFGSRPAILVSFGVIGTGKSTIASALSEELSFEVVSSDMVRKRISGISKFERRYEEYDTGIYSRDVTKKTYDEVFDNAEAIVSNGKSVIVDASFSKTIWRESLVERAESLGAHLYFIQAQAPKNIIEQRLTTREKQEKTISDGRIEILGSFISDFEEPLEISKESLIRIDTTKTISENIGIIFNKILHTNCDQ